MLIANETFSSCLLKLEEKFMHKIKLFLTVGNKFYRNTLRKIKNLPILKTHTRTKKILESWNSQYRTKEIIKIPSAGVKKNTGARVSFDTKAKLEIPENRGKNGHRSIVQELPKQKRKLASIRESLWINEKLFPRFESKSGIRGRPFATSNLLYEGGGGRRRGSGHNAQYRQHCLR